MTESSQNRDKQSIKANKQGGAHDEPGRGGVKHRFKKGNDTARKILSKQRTELLNCQWRQLRLEDECADMNKRDQEENLQGIYQVVEKLYSRQIQPQGDGDSRTDQGRRAEDRQHSNGRTKCDAQ